MALTPAQIHAHEHRGPVLTLRAAGTGVDFEHYAKLILLAAEHVAQLKILDFGDGIGIERIDFAFLHESFLEEIPCELKLVDSLVNLLIAVDPRLNVLDFFHLCLCFLGMLPKVGHMSAEFFLLYLNFLAVDVKDTSSAPACAQKSLLIVPE